MQRAKTRPSNFLKEDLARQLTDHQSDRDGQRTPQINESDEFTNSQQQRQEANAYFGNLNDSGGQNNASNLNGHKLTLPGMRENGGNHVFSAITPSEAGGHIKQRRAAEIVPENNSSGGQTQINIGGGKDDFTQGGTNFGTHSTLLAQSDDTSTKQHLELQQGQPMRSLRSLMGMSNRLSIYRYKRNFGGLILFFCDTLVTFDICILLIHILLAVLSERDDECWNIIYCVAAINVICQASINIFHDQKMKQAADSVNKLNCEKFVFNRRHKRFLQRPWDDLHVGDIIKIKNNNQVPADCLILDIKSIIHTQDQVAYVKGGPQATHGETEVKKSCQNTQIKTGNRLSDSKFVQLLSGQIKWEYNSRGKYAGSLKLNENPAAFEFKSEHIVNRGSSLYLTEQMICMVLNIGDECLGSVMRERQLRLPSLFTRFLRFKEVKYQKYYYGEMVHNVRILQLIALAISFMSWIMIVFVHLILGSTPLSKFEANIIQSHYDKDIQGWLPEVVTGIASLQSQYLLFYPYLIKIVLDCVTIFHNLFVLWDINLVPSNMNITNYFALTRLSQVSNMVLSPSSILGYRQNVVLFSTAHNKEYLNLNPKLSQVNAQESQSKPETSHPHGNPGQGPDGAHPLPQNDGNQSDDSSAGSDDEAKNEIDYLPISRNSMFRFDNQNVADTLHLANKVGDKTHIAELLRICALCHSSVMKESTKGREEIAKPQGQRLNHNFKSIYKFDEAQLNFANSFKYGFTSRKGNALTIQVQGRQEVYEEMAMIQVDLRGIAMTVQVLRPFGSLDGCTMVFKAPLQAIKIFMKEELWQRLDNDLMSMTKQGIQAICFGKKELDCEYAADLYRVIAEVQTLYKGNKQKLQEALMTQCENLDLIGTLGIKPYLNYRNSMFMEEVHRNGIKVWLLSSQLEYETILQINASEFLSGCSQPLNVKGQTERQVEESLKACLKSASDRMQAQHEKEREKTQDKSSTTRLPSAKQSGAGSKTGPKNSGGGSRNPKASGGDTRVDSKGNKLQQPLEIVFTNGYALSIIMKDESLLKIFLILCSLCNCVVGSSVSVTQKAELVKQLKEFNVQANLGYVLSIIGNASDMYMINEADVSIGLIQKYRSSDNIALTDMNVTELHSLTYILFKHASHLNRRQRVLIGFFFYRTVLMMAIITYYVISAGLSAVLPFQMFFTMIFMHILTPLQYFLFGISHKDYGFDQFHRIFGEYRNNQFVNLFTGTYALATVSKAFLDAFLLCFFALSHQLITQYSTTPVIYNSGIVVSQEAYICYNSIILSLIQLKRMRDNNSNIQFFQPFYYLCFFLSIIFVLEDDNLIGLRSLFQAPAMILQLVLVSLCVFLQETVYKVLRQMLPTKTRESMLYYKNVEEMIFMEEYEDSQQEFQIINNTAQTQVINKQFKTRELVAINQNMLRLHRSDSMDQILERINITGESNPGGSSDNKIVNRSTLINKYLKLNDFNKELEYQSQVVDQRSLEPMMYTLYSLLILLTCHIAIEISNPVADDRNKVAIVVILASLIVLSAGLLIVLKRVKDVNYGRILLCYIFLINIIANIEKSFTLNTQRSELVFYSVIACSFLLRLNSFFTVSFLCFISMICYCQLSFGNLLYRNGTEEEQELSLWEQVESFYRILNVLIFLTILILYSYWDETTRKIGFVINFRKQKEFQKSKQILNILVPSIVRSRIQEGQKNFSDAQGMVTIVFCDIEGFDEIVQLYEGKELIDLLDQTYNAFDQLCDQYGLQKVETVGKTYMACGGLKIVESKIDSRLLGNHFSVRVTDFAFEMLNVANSIKLKTGQKLRVKVGVHTGDVVAGVVGETKPQFSLIGDTVNKTSRVCSKCPPKQLLISKETHKQLEIYSNNFQFESMEVFMKGIGTEKAYKVFKKGLRGRLAHQQTGSTPLQRITPGINTLVYNSVGGPSIDKQGIQIKGQVPSQSLTPSNSGANDLKPKHKNRLQQDQTDDQAQYQEIVRTERSQDTHGERASEQHSQSDAGDEVRKQFGNFKEDRIIVNNPALNIKYKLVERPRFLLQFNQKEQEQEFQQFTSKFYIHETIWFLIIKACMDILLFFTIGWRADINILYVQLAWVIPYIILAAILIRVIAVSILNRPNVVAYSITLIVLYFSFAFAINTSQSIFDHEKQGVYTTCKQQLESYALIVFTLRAFQTRSTIISQALFVVSYGVHVFTDVKQGATIAGFAEIAAFICFTALLTINGYFREMAQRKQYNNERIIDIEIEKTEDLLSKLVPFHVLSGIKNDQRVVDILENVTLLYTDMVGFTQFSNNVKNPLEVVQLLSKLFSKFDQLTDAHGVYKVHTIGDCYVIMGYTGKTPKYRRTLAVQIEEAYRVVKVGLEMIEIIREVRESSPDPNLRSLDMRIGIHTGKIVGGIIGTKVVRYDIFGQDVLIANKMESNGKQGCVCISDGTYALLKQNQFIVDTLDFTEHDSFEVGERKIQSYLVEQIFMENSMGSSDADFSSHDITSRDEEDNDKDEEGSESESQKGADMGFRETEANLYAIPQHSKRGNSRGDKFVSPDDD